jgi:hypothetical protein
VKTAIDFFVVSCTVLLRMKHVSGKSCGEKSKHFMFSGPFFKNLAVYEIMWKNVLQPIRPQMTIWRMRIACWTPKATDTFSEYVTIITLRLQQLLHECASLLRYTYIDSLV